MLDRLTVTLNGMALVQQNTRRNARGNSRNSAINYLVPAVAGLASRAMDSASRQVVNNLMQQKNGQNGGANQVSGGNGGQNSGGGRRRRRKRGGGQGGQQQGVSPGNALSTFRIAGTNTRSLSTVLRATGLLSNSATNAASQAMQVGYSAANSSFLFTLMNNSDRNLLNAFTYFRIKGMQIKIIGSNGANVSGVMAIGFTDNINGSITPAYADIQNCRVYGLSSANGSINLNVPLDAGPYFLLDTSQDLMHRSCGMVQWYATNTNAVSTIFATIEVVINLLLW